MIRLMQVLAWLAWKLFLRTPLQRRAMRKHQQRSGRERRLGIFRGHQKRPFETQGGFLQKLFHSTFFWRKTRKEWVMLWRWGMMGDIVYVPPRKLTRNLKMMVSNRNLLFQGFIFRFHVSFPGCMSDSWRLPLMPQGWPGWRRAAEEVQGFAACLATIRRLGRLSRVLVIGVGIYPP